MAVDRVASRECCVASAPMQMYRAVRSLALAAAAVAVAVAADAVLRRSPAAAVNDI